HSDLLFPDMALPGIAGQMQHFGIRIKRRTGMGLELAADAQAQLGPETHLEADFHRQRIPERYDSRVAYAGLDESAEHMGRIARSAAADLIGCVGNDERHVADLFGLRNRLVEG